MGRPPKEKEVEQDINPEVEAKPEPIKLKAKVVGVGDYLQEAREMLLVNGRVDETKDVWNVAISILYSRNKVIGIVQKAGETRFVCEA